VSIEGYALHGVGKLTNIVEATMLVKTMIYNNNTPLRIYTPSMIKKFATGNGTAGKVSMFNSYENEPAVMDLSHLTPLQNPYEDIVDAYWVAKLLQTELKLRRGLLTLNELTVKRIEVFNAVSKSQPINLLVRDFITRIEKD
jgi:hypothetical protein